MRKRNRTLRASVAMAALLILAGCSAAGKNDVGSLTSQDAVDQEYASTLARLTFPPAYPPKSALPRPSEKSLYEAGFGTGMAERQWICSWEREWLKSQSPVALTQLEGAPHTLFMSKQLDEAGRRLFAGYLTKARLGDPSGIQQDVDQNCG